METVKTADSQNKRPRSRTAKAALERRKAAEPTVAETDVTKTAKPVEAEQVAVAPKTEKAAPAPVSKELSAAERVFSKAQEMTFNTPPPPTVLLSKSEIKAIKRKWEKAHFLGWFTGCPTAVVIAEQHKRSYESGVADGVQSEKSLLQRAGLAKLERAGGRK